MAYEKMSEADLLTERFDQPPAIPRVRYVVCATPRSGSQFLARLLVNAEIGVPAAYFNARLAHRLAGRWGIDLARQGAVPYLQRLVAIRTTPNGVWGATAWWGPFNANQKAVERVLETEARFIFLYRRNLLAQAIAAHLSAGSGLWGFDATPSEPPDTRFQWDDPTGVKFYKASIRAAQEAWRGYYRTLGTRPYVLACEDLAADQPGHVHAIAQFLGLVADQYRIPAPEPKHAGCPPHVVEQHSYLLQRLGTP
jgi:LPS sulfotransferase NodH